MLMRIQKFTSRQKKILSYVNRNASATYEQIAKACGTRSHVARAEVQALIKAKVITPVIIIDPTAIGLTKFNVFFSISPKSAKDRQQFIDYLVSHPNISWVSELAGEFDFGIVIMARNILDLEDSFRSILSENHMLIVKKEMVVDYSWTYYGKGYLIAPEKLPPPIVFKLGAEQFALTSLDRAILKLLAVDAFMSQQEIADKTNSPLSTVNNRIKLLSSKGVIVGYVNSLNYSKLNIHAFRLLISYGGISLPLRGNIFSFADNHPNIISMTLTLGAWDVEFSLELEDPHQIHKIISDLRGLSENGFFKSISLVRFDDLKWCTVAPGMLD
ncbi:MAG TPA: winged helix-turn-helix transcriptional regulator [Oligoflexia bacterium]|nr:winged helix-turn-helix transcriptional regulator [Oligoflexia bacterium]HMP48848.1 winged helix-turn-helix transcriptional regulator [Oligoflexia bacterium]